MNLSYARVDLQRHSKLRLQIKDKCYKSVFYATQVRQNEQFRTADPSQWIGCHLLTGAGLYCQVVDSAISIFMVGDVN